MPKLAEKELCVGCTACVNVCTRQCIEIKKDSEGFSYPEFVRMSECVNCGVCEKVCPLSKDILIKKETTSAYAALSIDETIRRESSSGGIFTELAKSIISKKGVVFGAAYDEQFNVQHYSVDNVENLHRLRGAKYAESNLGNSFTNILDRLKRGQLVLFSGTPCQVAGLKSFVRKDFENLLCIDFVCHGIPSPVAWQAYIEYRAKEDANGELPCNINLRSKNTGWSKYRYSNVFEYKNGKKHSTLSSQSLFMKLFIGDYISRPSCEVCKFKGYSRNSDITLGDFWGIWDIEPEMDDNKGTSVVLVHSDKGRLLWSNINTKIKYKEVSLEQASQQNSSMMVSAKANLNRSVALKKIKDGKIETCEELFVGPNTPKISFLTKVKGKFKRLINLQ